MGVGGLSLKIKIKLDFSLLCASGFELGAVPELPGDGTVSCHAGQGSQSQYPETSAGAMILSAACMYAVLQARMLSG